MLIEVNDLTDDALNFAVAFCEREDYRASTEYDGIGLEYPAHRYTLDWGQSGTIVEKHHIRWNKLSDQYYAWMGGHDYIDPLHEQIHDGADPIDWTAFQYGQTILEACLRCYVQATCGDRIEIPDAIARQSKC